MNLLNNISLSILKVSNHSKKPLKNLICLKLMLMMLHLVTIGEIMVLSLLSKTKVNVDPVGLSQLLPTLKVNTSRRLVT
jgi:hypothetical protein